ncbi:aminotransferase class III-fold pyridoxal phosphate-dependent enzyme [Sphingobacterium sp. E70]|nr:aminotransferase class III-fold pyridoxal phosphate-dependent enzyme [Sphingobacterium sp. E70]ULT27140.1 aminotransferase class III-fold pyridoxal phosphate-dependent enzyme [Sphingobacterium sp. E70]
MAATIISPAVNPLMGQLGTTFGGNHLACATAIAVLEVLRDEKLIDNAAQVGGFLISELKDIAAVAEVRGKGLMIGVEFDADIQQLRQELLFDEKIFTGYAGAYTLRLLPPLSFTMEHAQIFLRSLKKLLKKK